MFPSSLSPINCVSVAAIYFCNHSDKIYLLVVAIIILNMYLCLFHMHKPEHYINIIISLRSMSELSCLNIVKSMFISIQINIEYNDPCKKHFTMKCGNSYFWVT